MKKQIKDFENLEIIAGDEYLLIQDSNGINKKIQTNLLNNGLGINYRVDYYDDLPNGNDGNLAIVTNTQGLKWLFNYKQAGLYIFKNGNWSTSKDDIKNEIETNLRLNSDFRLNEKKLNQNTIIADNKNAIVAGPYEIEEGITLEIGNNTNLTII